MAKKIVARIKRRAYWLPAFQLASVLLVMLGFLWLSDEYAALSVLLGGLVSVVPTVYFTYHLFIRTGARAARQIVRTFYRAEAIKLALMAIFFIALTKLTIVILEPFVIGFIVAQFAALVAPLLYAIDAMKRKDHPD